MSADDRATATATDACVEGLLQLGGQIALLLDHMARWAAQAPEVSEEPVPEILRRLLAETLEPRFAQLAPVTLTAGADLVALTVRTIEEELVLVPIPSRADRRRGAGGRPAAPLPRRRR